MSHHEEVDTPIVILVDLVDTCYLLLILSVSGESCHMPNLIKGFHVNLFENDRLKLLNSSKVSCRLCLISVWIVLGYYPISASYI